MDKLEYIPGDIVKSEYGEAAGKIGFVTNAILKRKGSYGLFVFIGKEFQGSSKDDWISTYNDEVSPIPLTPEILEKNGWKKEMYHDWRHYMTLESTILYLSEGIDGVFSVCVGLNMSEIASISFVHELQHLLYGLKINSEMEV